MSMMNSSQIVVGLLFACFLATLFYQTRQLLKFLALSKHRSKIVEKLAPLVSQDRVPMQHKLNQGNKLKIVENCISQHPVVGLFYRRFPNAHGVHLPRNLHIANLLATLSLALILGVIVEISFSSRGNFCEHNLLRKYSNPCK